MAGNILANTFATYDAKGLREDLSPLIFNVAPFMTPFLSSMKKGKATNVLHQWQTDTLAAPAANAFVQGDDVDTAGYDAVTATVLLTNYTQISRKSWIISRTEEQALKAGRTSEIALQGIKKGKELKKDLEYNILGLNQAKVAPASTVVPKTASVMSWIKTNTSKDAGGSDPSTADGAATRSDSSSLRPFTEAMLKAVQLSVYTNSGEPADMLFVHPQQKQVVSAFSGNATRMVDAKTSMLNASIDVYKGDFGEIKIVPCLQMRTRDAFLMNTDYWAMAWFTPIRLEDLAKTGDATKKLLVTEWALEACNEKASGGAFDLS